MKNQLLNRRIPTILGVGLVLLGIVLTTIIVGAQTGFKSTASSLKAPQNVKITNLSDNSFTITYTTDAAIIGSIGYGNSKQLGNTQLEDEPQNIHSITVEKLRPLTKYYLVIVSGQNTFLNNGVPFEILTGPNISSPSATKTAIKGKVILPSGNAPNEALVYLSADNSQILSASVAKNGEFNFDLKRFRTDDLSSYFEFDENTVLKILATNNSLESNVSFSLNKTGLIPTTTLSNDYNFTKAYIPAASSSARIGFPPEAIKSENLKPQILTPKKDQSFTDQKPQFQGTSLPNENVEIIIHSEENIQAVVTADSNGNWTYRPPNNLSEGVHTITIKTRDSAGILTTIMQSFTVFAQEQQISESATSTSKPTITLTPTPTPILIVTDMRIESKGGLAPTGDSSFLLVIGGIITTVVGIVLLLLTRTVL